MRLNFDEWTIQELAEKVGVSRQTIYGWVKSGKLKSINKSNKDRARYVIKESDWVDFLNTHSHFGLKPRLRDNENDIIDFGLPKDKPKEVISDETTTLLAGMNKLSQQLDELIELLKQLL